MSEQSTGIRAALAEDFHVLDALGGWRGIIESSVPTLIFLIMYACRCSLALCLLVSVGAAVAGIVVRAIQRITVLPAIGGLIAIAVSAVIAWKSGQSANFFVTGLLTNIGYGIALALSLLIRWPALGVLIGFLRSEGTAWRTDPAQRVLRRRYYQVTWMWLLLFLVRIAVQGPLYLAHATQALGIARLFMGMPLFALVAWFTWLMVRSVPQGQQH
ncbi:DUF3159 domain-containing protein [Trueperella sp. LYQ143]|uniref:DUF3159 domain-containing protein n=1 Tax=unclassified Trueperella TaxID=2630174 RepID=UPI0039830F84